MQKILFMITLISGFFMNAQTYLGSVVLSSFGIVPINLDVVLDTDASIATFTFSGPESMYYTVGFDALSMADAPYIFLTQESTVQERKLTGRRSAGNLLTPEIIISSDNVVNGVRTIVFTRALTGLSADYYDFSSITNGTEINLIWAEGNNLKIKRHSRRGNASITFLEKTIDVNKVRK